MNASTYVSTHTICNSLKDLTCCRSVVEMIFGEQGSEKEMINYTKWNMIKMPVTCPCDLSTARQQVFAAEERVKITLNE